jgi:hypothetical protein
MYDSGREGKLFDPFSSAATLSSPVSAFSRYAALYSLGGDDLMRYGRSCASTAEGLAGKGVNMALLSHQSHGNWVCDPKTFY